MGFDGKFYRRLNRNPGAGLRAFLDIGQACLKELRPHGLMAMMHPQKHADHP